MSKTHNSTKSKWGNDTQYYRHLIKHKIKLGQNFENRKLYTTKEVQRSKLETNNTKLKHEAIKIRIMILNISRPTNTDRNGH